MLVGSCEHYGIISTTTHESTDKDLLCIEHKRLDYENQLRLSAQIFLGVSMRSAYRKRNEVIKGTNCQ